MNAQPKTPIGEHRRIPGALYRAGSVVHPTPDLRAGSLSIGIQNGPEEASPD